MTISAVKDLVPINGERLRAFRTSAQWSQQELADASMVSRSYIAEIEKGQKSPRPLVAESLANALGLRLDRDLLVSDLIS